MLFTDQHMKEALEAQNNIVSVRLIGQGVTRSSVATAKPVNLQLKRRDVHWDKDSGGRLYRYGESASSRAEVMWWNISQELGGTWRRVPPAYEVHWLKLPIQAQSFHGTCHYWVDGAVSGWETTEHKTRDDVIKMRIMDILLNNVDRNSTNSLLYLDELVWIDHGRSACHIPIPTGSTDYSWKSKCAGEQQFLSLLKPLEGQELDMKGAVYHALADILEKWDAIRTIIEMSHLPMATEETLNDKLIALLSAVEKLCRWREHTAYVKECNCGECRRGKSKSQRSRSSSDRASKHASENKP